MIINKSTIEDLKILEEAGKRVARDNFLKFVLYIKPDYQVNWHHRLLCSYLDRFVKGEITRLMVFMPPQHGKSQLVSRSLPAYILGKNPNTKIVLASYSGDLASSFNRDCQRIIDSPEYVELFKDTFLNSSNVTTVSRGYLRNSEIFQPVGYTGFLKSTGVGNALTGTTADIAIIDDPVKDTMDASSATFQMRNWNWYNDVLFTRINNKTKILITQTRWHENDLSGLLIKAMKDNRGEDWTILNLPAIKEDDSNPDDPRSVGDALWPEWHSLEKLHTIQKQNSRTFQSLYQQNPKPQETGGEAYKQFKIWRNTESLTYDHTKPLHLSIDFNVRPAMHGIVMQVDGKQVKVIDEVISYSPRNNTKGFCQSFIDKYRNHNAGLFIYGDPAGRNASTRQEEGHNDYTIIVNELKQYKPQLRVAYSHPSIKMRVLFINEIFENGYNDIEININSKCLKTIEDLQFIKEDVDGTKLKEKAVDLTTGKSYEKYGHLSDCLDYFICEAFKQDFKKWQDPRSALSAGAIYKAPIKSITF